MPNRKVKNHIGYVRAFAALSQKRVIQRGTMAVREQARKKGREIG